MSLVEWDDVARDRLADLWVQATPAERTTIERVVLELERDLAATPLTVGESRFGRVRVVCRPPLTFWFELSPTGNRVRIGFVHRPRRGT